MNTNKLKIALLAIVAVSMTTAIPQSFATAPLCDGVDATIYKLDPTVDNSNTFVVDGVNVDMERWNKDGSVDGSGSPTFSSNEGWIITGTGNRATPLDDIVQGTDKDDLIKPGWGDDTVCAGDGADTVQGGWGDDTLFGEAGDDLLKGGHGDDDLTGGDGTTDEAQGGQDTDTCDAETESTCEI